MFTRRQGHQVADLPAPGARVAEDFGGVLHAGTVVEILGPEVDEPEDAPIPEMEMDMFSGEGPSEAEIERIGKEAEAASKAGLMKAPEVDMSKLKEKSRKKKEERKEDGFEEFNMDDLM